jgi:hypothetical protein
MWWRETHIMSSDIPTSRECLHTGHMFSSGTIVGKVVGVYRVIPASLVILFTVRVMKVKCILRSKVLLQRQRNIGNTRGR